MLWSNSWSRSVRAPRGDSDGRDLTHLCQGRVDNWAAFRILHRPNAHATISGSSSCQNESPCDPTRSVITTSRAGVAQRHRPSSRVVTEERLQGAGDEVRARKRTRHQRQAAGNRRRARRKRSRRRRLDGEARLRARAPHRPRHRTPLCVRRASPTPNRDSHPSADVLDEELLVRCEPLRFKARRVLMEPQRLVGSRWTPTIIVDGTSAASRNPPHCEIS